MVRRAPHPGSSLLSGMVRAVPLALLLSFEKHHISVQAFSPQRPALAPRPLSSTSVWRSTAGDDTPRDEAAPRIHARDLWQSVVRPTVLAASVAFAALAVQPAAFALDAAPATVATAAPPAYDETWNLVRKYALDQKFHGQNWQDAYAKYADGLDPASTDEDRVMKATTNLVASLGDKYSRVLDKDAYARIQKFDLIGVGATLMPDEKTKEIMVGAALKNSAAEQAGLKVGDVVVAVNGMQTAQKTAFDIVDQISEDPTADKITFTIRSGNDAPRDVSMSRKFLEVRDPVSYRVSERRPDGTTVGYVRVAEFNALVKPRLEAALRDLDSQGANAYVLDVRGNPGGAFQSAVEIAGLFLSDRLATNVVDGNGVELAFRTATDRTVVGARDPLAIWVDGGSASASEVLAGALRGNCRAVVMGETSFGKGLVQAVYGLKNGYGLVLTVARYLTPEGTDINKVGIVPDVSKEAALPAAPGFVPILGSDTSRVDFKDVTQRLSMCSK